MTGGAHQSALLSTIALSREPRPNVRAIQRPHRRRSSLQLPARATLPLAAGKRLGRPKGSLGGSRLDGRDDKSLHFLTLGVSKLLHREITGVTTTTLYNFVATRGLKVDA